MGATTADFGRRLFSRQPAAATGGFNWMAAALLLLALALFLAVPATRTRPWRALLAPPAYAPWGAGALGVVSLCIAAGRVRRSRIAQHYHEGGVHSRLGRRHQCLAYADAERVTFVVRTVGDRVERSVTFAGPGGQPQLFLWTNLADDDSGDDGTAMVAQVQNVATRVIGAVAARVVERVDRGEVVKWTEGLWLDQAGLRVGDPTHGRVVPWNAVDGVKDGSSNGKIEVYAFGVGQPVATARTYDPDALPGFQAFMRLLDRGQAPAVAA